MQSIRSAWGLVWWLILVVVHGEDYIDNSHRQALQDVHLSSNRDAHLSNNTDAASSPAASEQMLVHGGLDMTRIGTSTSSNISNSSNSSSKGSAGVNVLAVMLVTASSVMVFLVLRLSLCQWNTSTAQTNNSNGASAIETTTATTTFAERKDGLGQDVIDKFTVLVDYSSLLGAMASNSSSMENVRSCTVCLSEFAAEDNKIRILPACNHSFHTECIDLWLFSHMSCPLCRGSLIPTSDHPQASAPVVLEVPMLISTPHHLQASAPVVLEDPMASAADDAERVQCPHPQSNHLVVDIK